MKSGDLIEAVNVVVRTDGLHQRAGYAERTTGLDGAVIALMDGGGTRAAATATSLYDVTAPAATTIATGFGGQTWSWDRIANSAGSGLICCNGIDAIWVCLAGTWRSPTITGVDSHRFASVAWHVRRAVFVLDGSLQLWYLPVNAIAGAARMIDCGPVCTRGGALVAVASWRRGGGRSAADSLVAVTSAGEMVVYEGSDPDIAATWRHVGTYDVPPPVGKQCFCQIGGRLAYLSIYGLLVVPDILGAAQSDEEVGALTDKIWTAYLATSEAAADGTSPYSWDSSSWTFDSDGAPLLDVDVEAVVGTRSRWSLTESASENVVLINLPGSGEQYVYEPWTKAWSRWTGLSATSWGDAGTELWFGTSDGKICVYGGTTDNAADIQSWWMHAYARASGRPDRQNIIKPLFAVSPTYRPRVKCLFDFSPPPASLTATTAAYQPAAQSVAGRGRDAAVAVAVRSDRGCVYIGSDGVVEAGRRP